MECAFSVASRIGTDMFGEVMLTAEQYADGTPDWHNVDLDGAVRPRRRVRPTPARSSPALSFPRQ
jgi:hypothetical protein